MLAENGLLGSWFTGSCDYRRQGRGVDLHPRGSRGSERSSQWAPFSVCEKGFSVWCMPCVLTLSPPLHAVCGVCACVCACVNPEQDSTDAYGGDSWRGPDQSGTADPQRPGSSSLTFFCFCVHFLALLRFHFFFCFIVKLILLVSHFVFFTNLF